MEEKNLNLADLLKVKNFKKVENFSDLSKYFDVNILDEDGTPKIVTEQKTIILMDNEDFNETYLIDVFNKTFEDTNLEHVELVYIDNFDVRKQLVAKDIEQGTIDKKAYEKTYLTPCMMLINPISNRFDYFQEMVAPFEYEVVRKIFEMVKFLD